MGTPSIGIAEPAGRSGRSSFRRVFVWYCAGVIGATVALSGAIDIVLLIWYEFTRRTGAIPYDTLRSEAEWVFFSAPIVSLVVAILFFAWLMGRQISQPVRELIQAVEKIRQRDLDFTITYSARNELGDLCAALNQLRGELQESLEREWRKQEEMRTMITAISHDLRTPVTIIQGHIDGLARAEAGEKRNQRLERYMPVLEASSQRMTRLLNDMLLVATLEQTSFVIQPRPVALEEEMARKAQVYTLQAAAAGVTFAYSARNHTPDTTPVSLDFDRIEQVLDNLFENALRYTPADGEIGLTSTRDPQALTFILRDSGCGVAPEDLPHVWEKFYRGQASRGGAAGMHSGLGLSICKLLVERHGGTIALCNHAAGGCEVTVHLPTTER